MILICGWLLAFFQFLRELMWAHFERQMNKVDSTPAVTNAGAFHSPPSTSDPDTSSHPTEKIISESKMIPQRNAVAPAGVESRIIIEYESPLKVIDISDDLNTVTTKPSSPFEIK